MDKIKDFIFKAVGKKGTSVDSISEKLGVQPYEIYGVVELLKQQGYLVDIIDGIVYKLNKPKKGRTYAFFQITRQRARFTIRLFLPRQCLTSVFGMGTGMTTAL